MIFYNYNDLEKFIKRIRDKKIISTNGCFDILHSGHVEYLNQAKQLGDFLIVGINSDSSVKRLKGDLRPIVPEKERAFLIDNLKAVDAVCVFEEDTPINLLKVIKPNIHVKGGDYSKKLPESEIVEKNGGKIEFLKFVAGKSTTNIIEKIKENYIK